MSALSLTTTLQGFTNPFEYDIINIVTKAVVTVDVQKDIETLNKKGLRNLMNLLNPG